MTRRAQSVTLGIFVVISFASLMTTAYLYGKAGAQDSKGSRADPSVRTRLLLGRIVRIQPLHLYVESSALGSKRTYDVLIAPQTDFLRLVPWAPGEKEEAAKAHEAYLKRMDVKAGDPISAPPMRMKPEPLDLTTLVQGTMIGVLSNIPIDPAEPIIAVAIRPLTPEEASTGQVDNTFPL